MRSPRGTHAGGRRSTYNKRQANQANMAANFANGIKRSGVCVSKSYQMLCGRCGRRFTKIMTTDIMQNESLSVFDM